LIAEDERQAIDMNVSVCQKFQWFDYIHSSCYF